MDKLVLAAGEGDETATRTLRDVKTAYGPVRTALKDRFGETVTLYRYTDPEIEALYDNKPTQLFTSERMARDFAYEGRRADAVEVRIDDIIAAPAKDKINNGYHEFIVDIRGLGR
jgi:Holliday junction resolvasome RuvABC ATP-dependent DNA helicase subunit